MDFTWLESTLFGLLSGLTDILPVSTQAHRMIMLKLFGVTREPVLMRLLINIGIFAALYYNCQTHIIRMGRARRLSKVPKRKRKRPLDTRSLMDLSLWKTMLIPVILAFLFYDKVSGLGSNMIVLAGFLFLNGIILYVPQFLPGGNKDSRMLSRVEGLLIGLGGGLSVFPGISAVGAGLSIGSVCGIDRAYGLTMVLLMNLGVTVGLMVFNIISIATIGLGVISFGIVVKYILSGAAAFAGTMLGIRIMRQLAANVGYSVFAYYCWGIALFTFVLNLIV